MKSSLSNLLDKHGLIRRSAGVFVIQVGSTGLNFLNALVLAQLLTLSAYGDFAQVLAATTTTATILSLGTPSLITRELASNQYRERWSLMKGIVYWASRNVIAICTGIAALSLFLLFTAMPRIWRIPGSLAIVIAFLLTLNLLRAAVLRGFNHIISADIPDSLVQPLAISCAIGSTIFFIKEPGIDWAVAIQTFGVISATAVGALILHRTYPREWKKVIPTKHPARWNQATLVFAMISTFSILESQLAVLLTGAFAGPEQAALFQVGARLAALVVFGLVGTNAALMPRLAALWSKGDLVQCRILVRQTAMTGFAIAVVCSIALLVVPNFFLGLFGAAYKQADVILRVLVAGQLVNAASGPCALVLSMTGFQSKSLKALVLAVIVNLVAGLLLIPNMKAVGGAIAVTLSLVIWNTLMSCWAWRCARINTMVIGRTRGN